MEEKRTRYILFILLQSLVYGIGNPLTKVAYESITPLWLLAVRFLVATALFACLFGRRTLRAVRRVRWTVWLPPALCCAGAYITCNLALNLTAATNVGFIMSLPVLFTPLLGTLLYRRRYELRRLPPQLCAVCGLYLLCCNGGSFSLGPGELLALLDALFIALTLVSSERALAELGGVEMSALQAAVTMTLSLAGALLFDDIPVLSAVAPGAWWVALYLAVVCTVLAYLLQNFAVAHLSAATVSLLQCTQPILTGLSAFFLLHETLTGPGLAGAGVIVLALLADGWLQSRRSAARRPVRS